MQTTYEFPCSQNTVSMVSQSQLTFKFACFTPLCHNNHQYPFKRLKEAFVNANQTETLHETHFYALTLIHLLMSSSITPWTVYLSAPPTSLPRPLVFPYSIQQYMREKTSIKYSEKGCYMMGQDLNTRNNANVWSEMQRNEEQQGGLKQGADE